MEGVPEMPAVPPAGQEVPDGLIYDAEQARAVREYLSYNTSPAGKQQRGADFKRVFQITAGAAMPEVVHFAHLMQQLVQGLQQLEQGQRQVLARIDNVRHRSYNKRVMQGPAPVLLKPLCREQAAAGGAHGPGALPPAGYFPADKQALFSLTHDEINNLEAFYGQPFAGATVTERRLAFADFVTE